MRRWNLYCDDGTIEAVAHPEGEWVKNEDCTMNWREQDTIDLALMIRRLAARVQKHEPGSKMATQAIRLLERKGIRG